MQAVHDLLQRQRPNTRRSKLDRQRHAVQAPADLLSQREIVVADTEVGAGVAGAVSEQLDGLVGHGQRRHPPAQLAGHPQRLTAGGQDRQPRARRQQRDHYGPAGVEQMLAIIKQQQRFALAEESDQQVHGGAARLIGQTQRACDGHRCDGRVGDRSQVDLTTALRGTR